MYSLLNSSVRLLYAALMLQQDYLGRFVPITQCRGRLRAAQMHPTLMFSRGCPSWGWCIRSNSGRLGHVLVVGPYLGAEELGAPHTALLCLGPEQLWGEKP